MHLMVPCRSFVPAKASIFHHFNFVKVKDQFKSWAAHLHLTLNLPPPLLPLPLLLIRSGLHFNFKFFVMGIRCLYDFVKITVSY